ncbi:MAG TPA: hypothetical protein VFB58_06045 [Chloroflexota bacterium]|nr:hypothetical protein [Chloroflexota bacterium]
MPRYEGMEDLLQQVRERLERAQAQHPMGKGPFDVELPVDDATYDTLVGSLGVLQREAEAMSSLVASPRAGSLSGPQRDHVLQLLGQVLEELWTAEAALQGVR